jgi:hypothetical protein
MGKPQARTQQLYLTIAAILTGLAVVVQFYLLIVNRVTAVPETIIRFFSYFTILTNILVAFCFTNLLVKPNFAPARFFSKPTTVTAIAVYITVVGIVYNIILRFAWNPRGLQMVADELLHLVIPVLFILYWLIFAPKARLQWKNVFPWLIYPVLYILFILIRGALSGFYPYPFIDVKKLGYSKVVLNSSGLFIGFLLLSLLFIAIAKMMSRHSR